MDREDVVRYDSFTIHIRAELKETKIEGEGVTSDRYNVYFIFNVELEIEGKINGKFYIECSRYTYLYNIKALADGIKAAEELPPAKLISEPGAKALDKILQYDPEIDDNAVIQLITEILSCGVRTIKRLDDNHVENNDDDYHDDDDEYIDSDDEYDDDYYDDSDDYDDNNYC